MLPVLWNRPDQKTQTSPNSHLFPWRQPTPPSLFLWQATWHLDESVKKSPFVRVLQMWTLPDSKCPHCFPAAFSPVRRVFWPNAQALCLQVPHVRKFSFRNKSWWQEKPDSYPASTFSWAQNHPSVPRLGFCWKHRYCQQRETALTKGLYRKVGLR